MENDIDDLLDEVETKFVKPSTSNSSVTRTGRSSQCGVKEKQTKPTQKSKTPTNPPNALDAAIDDILDIDVTEKPDLNDSAGRDCLRSSVSEETNRSDQPRRCFPVFLGGSAADMGMGSSVNSRACDQLRCTSCDFKVCTFDDLAWSKDTDYLFLRNNVPDFQKLKSKLGRKKGCRAYCCQCTWKNVQELCELKDPNLKWVCGKHSS